MKENLALGTILSPLAPTLLSKRGRGDDGDDDEGSDEDEIGLADLPGDLPCPEKRERFRPTKGVSFSQSTKGHVDLPSPSQLQSERAMSGRGPAHKKSKDSKGVATPFRRHENGVSLDGPAPSTPPVRGERKEKGAKAKSRPSLKGGALPGGIQVFTEEQPRTPTLETGFAPGARKVRRPSVRLRKQEASAAKVENVNNRVYVLALVEAAVGIRKKEASAAKKESVHSLSCRAAPRPPGSAHCGPAAISRAT